MRAVTYKDILALEPTFISLDISVKSTGWVRSIDGKVEYDTYTLQSETERGRRAEFRQFITDLLGQVRFSTVYVEDVIAGTNFMTTKGLIQLNSIVDDLVDLKIVEAGKIHRVDNNKWKRYLRLAASIENSELKGIETKQKVRLCLNNLCFEEVVSQDIYDALGLVVAMIYKNKILKE